MSSKDALNLCLKQRNSPGQQNASRENNKSATAEGGDTATQRVIADNSDDSPIDLSYRGPPPSSSPLLRNCDDAAAGSSSHHHAGAASHNLQAAATIAQPVVTSNSGGGDHLSMPPANFMFPLFSPELLATIASTISVWKPFLPNLFHPQVFGSSSSSPPQQQLLGSSPVYTEGMRRSGYLVSPSASIAPSVMERQNSVLRQRQRRDQAFNQRRHLPPSPTNGGVTGAPSTSWNVELTSPHANTMVTKSSQPSRPMFDTVLTPSSDLPSTSSGLRSSLLPTSPIIFDEGSHQPMTSRSKFPMTSSGALSEAPSSSTSKSELQAAGIPSKTKQSCPIQFRPYEIPCDLCERTYATEGALAKHMKTHEDPDSSNKYNCKVCQKECSSLGSLRMHIRTHTLPCECTICGKAFSRTWLLQGHIRTHTGEKPYECSECGRAFADRSNLRAHMQTHQVVKRYSCKDCDRTFSRISLLKRHMNNCEGAAKNKAPAIEL